jgi:hypothetical protein
LVKDLRAGNVAIHLAQEGRNGSWADSANSPPIRDGNPSNLESFSEGNASLEVPHNGCILKHCDGARLVSSL